MSGPASTITTGIEMSAAKRISVVFRREFRSYFQTPLAAVFLVILSLIHI
jgi:hypothetical protein